MHYVIYSASWMHDIKRMFRLETDERKQKKLTDLMKWLIYHTKQVNKT